MKPTAIFWIALIFSLPLSLSAQSKCSVPTDFFNSKGIFAQASPNSTQPNTITSRIPWVENLGQWPKRVRFVAQTFAGKTYLTDDGVINYNITIDSTKSFLLRESFIGGQPDAMSGQSPTLSKTNYFLSNNPENWTKNAASFKSIELSNVWQNIDVQLNVHGNNVEKLFIIQPNGRPQDIQMKIKGASSCRIEKDGALLINSKEGQLKFTPPFAYQIIDNQQIKVDVSYVLNAKKLTEYSFSLGDYDPDYTVVIDPLLASTFIGGSEAEQAMGTRIAPDGNVVIAGWVQSNNFPTTPGAYATANAGSYDGFITKLTPDLSTIIASTYFGGLSDDFINNFDFSANGDITVIGYTFSTDLPTTAGAFDASANGSSDIFIAKFSADLSSLVASTYVGGADADYAHGVVVAPSGETYLAGNTLSTDYPTTAGVVSTTALGAKDAVITKLDANFTTLVASTYYGGTDWDQPNDIKVLPSGNVIIGGWTRSTDLPLGGGGYDATFDGVFDSFLASFDSDLTQVNNATYIGGAVEDHVEALFVDPSGKIYTIGWTTSSDYPTTAGAYDNTLDGTTDMTISAFSSDLTAMTESTLLGGSDYEQGYALTMDSQNRVIVAGISTSADFVAFDAVYDGSYNGIGDVAITRLSNDLSTVLSSTFVGGNTFDQPMVAIDVNGSDQVYFAGRTLSDDYPTTPGAYDQTYDNTNSKYDAIVGLLCLDSLPAANFTVDNQSGCKPFTVHYTNTTTGNDVDDILWQFPGGNPATSTINNPIVTYADTGSYTAIIIASNCAGSDTMTKVNYIFVDDIPSAGFTFTTNLLDANFNNTSDNYTSSSWDFGDGTTSSADNPLHSYDAPGTYTVILTVSNACGSVADTQDVVIIIPPVANFSADTTAGCAPLTVQFSDESTNGATSWYWDFPGGTPATSTDQNPQVTYANQGSYDVTLIATNSAGSDTITKANFIQVNDIPTVGFSVNTNGLAAIFTNSSANGSSDWDFGDGTTSSADNPLHSYDAPGTYTVILTVSNACGSAADTQDVVIIIPPVADFSVDTTAGCAPLTIQFSDESTNGATSWYWDFPGGTPATSTDQNPQVVYNNAGSFAVTLIASNGAGSDTVTVDHYIVVQGKPTADFSDIVSGLVASFSNLSTNADTYEWDFDDNMTSTDSDPIHSYSNPGTYQVRLIASNGCGSDTIFHTVTILDQPIIAGFAADTTAGCAPLTVQFSDLSTNMPSAWNWSFPGGTPSTSTDQNPQVVYNNAGSFAVTLIVSTNAGNKDTITVQNYIQVSLPPTANFVSDTMDLIGQFTNQSIHADNYQWFFGDGETSIEPNPMHHYPNPGTYQVTLIASNGCSSDTITQPITLGDIGDIVAKFTVDDTVGCAPLTVQFSDLSTNYPTTWTWIFPGGVPETSDEQNPTVTYAVGGRYSVTLVVSNGMTTDTLTLTDYIQVNEKPMASFSPSGNGLSIQLTNQSEMADTYLWQFDDGDTSTWENPTHLFANHGFHAITLWATNDCGSDSTTHNIFIGYGSPVATIEASDTVGCGPMTVHFSATLTNADSVKWIFPQGAPAYSYEFDPTVTFTEPGQYLVQLTAYNLTDSVTTTMTITVDGPPNVAFTYSSVEKKTTFVQSLSQNTTYTWDFGDGTILDAVNPVHDYQFYGNYTVILIAENSCGTEINQQDISVKDTLAGVFYRIDPNPGSGLYLLNLEAEVETDVSLFIYTTWGQLLKKYDWEKVKKLKDEPLDLLALPSSEFFYYIEFGHASDSGRLLKID